MVGSCSTADHDNPADMSDETIAGRYRLVEPLGRGSMSAVWLAEDAELGRQVAVKTLAPSADRARFEREARAAASLSHPNIAGLYDYGEADGRPYMVLEYLPGGTLEERLRDGALPDAETRRIGEEIAAGLAHAHARGLVHRDLKPANVLFDAEGRPKIADFGIARMTGGGTLTEAGTVLGTASYISPEQASGEPAGPPSDVYSFGVILFRMLTGRLPFTAANAMELVRLHRDEPAPPVRSVRPDAPADLAALADAALAKDPRTRPADGAALAATLAGDAAAATAILAPAATAAATQVLRPAGPARPARRRAAPLLLALAAAALLAGGAVAAWLATRSSGSSPPAAPPPTVHLPTVTAGRTSTAAPLTTAPATTAAETTTTAPTTTAHTTTARTTTAPTTTEAPPTTSVALPTTTVAPPTTTAPVPPTTTAVFPTTTAVEPTTTAPAEATTTAETTTAPTP
jgi:serine/threonine-protein kinase